jgi:hypothetical protein
MITVAFPVRCRRCVLVVLAALLLTALPAAAETFDLHIRRYCKPGTLCSYGSIDAYDQRLCEAVQEMNLIWEPAGFSFRPVIFPVDTTSPSDTTGLPAGMDQYWQVPGCADETPEFDPLPDHWRDNVARKNTTALSLMLTKGTNRCCSGIPRTFKNLDRQHGYFCDAHPTRSVLATGSLFAHETGHHWSLAHTHGACADTADGQDPTYDADAAVVTGCSMLNAEGNAEGCGSDQDCQDLGLGTCIADGLPVIGDTPADRCGVEACKRRCQGDNSKPCSADADCGTDAPCIRLCDGGEDEDTNGDLLDGHTWFASVSSERELVPVGDNLSQGSPHATWCKAEIKSRQDGDTSASDTLLPTVVTVRNVMSYHPAGCLGPYVLSGQRREAFTPDQLGRIAECRLQIAPRDAAHLPDVCANRGQDSDHDGICDLDDNCPGDRNTCQTDADGDGVGDVCDLCPADPTPTGDIDGDGIGDVCDEDRDGDGCLNDVDDHPDEGQLPTITTVYVGCPNESVTSYVSDAADTDGDGVKNCMDPDDDNDGLCDAPGPGCQFVDDPCPEMVGGCVVAAVGEPCPPAWFVCGIACVEYFLKAIEAINPDPTRELVFDRLWRVNGALFGDPLRGKTAAESVAAIGAKVGVSASAGVVAPAGVLPERVRLELWQRLPDGDERRVDVIGEYDAAHLRLGELVRGGLFRLLPGRDVTGAPMLDAETTYAIGIRADEATDGDGDRQPDLQDNCVVTANGAQQDADGDGFGNACDADLDQDGAVDADDVARIRACAGADLAVDVPLLEPMTFDGEVLGEPPAEPDRLAAARAAACRDADLDGDGRVDGTDASLAEAMLGQPPGPSAVDRGLRPRPPSLIGSPCADSVPLAPARILLARLDRQPGSQRVRLQGALVLPVPVSPPLDPVANGVLILLRDAMGQTLLEARLPGGAFQRSTHTGWKAKRMRARYRGRAGVGGIEQAALRWNEKGRVTLKVSGKRARVALAAAELPLLWEVVLDPAVAATVQCGETDFRAAPGEPSCVVKRGGAVVSCRQRRGGRR